MRLHVLACVIIQITAAIHCGKLVDNWICDGVDVLARRNGSAEHGLLANTRDWGADLVSVGNDGFPHVIVLGEALRFPGAEFVVNVDEKPLNPDSLASRGIGTGTVHARTPYWTYVPTITAGGRLLYRFAFCALCRSL